MKNKLAINTRIDCEIEDMERANMFAEELGNLLRIFISAADAAKAVTNARLEFRAESYEGDFPADLIEPSDRKENSNRTRNADMWEIPKDRLMEARGMVEVQKALDDVALFNEDPYAKGMSEGMQLILDIVEGQAQGKKK